MEEVLRTSRSAGRGGHLGVGRRGAVAGGWGEA